MSSKHRPQIFTGLLLGLTLQAPLAAQSRLYVLESDHAYHPVFKVSGGQPYIMENGKLVAAKGTSLALRKVEEYLPVFIAVRDKDARTTDVHLPGASTGMPTSISSVFDQGSSLGTMREASAGGKVDSQFHFSAKFESSDPMEDVFLVLETEFSGAGKSISVYEIGRMEPGIAKPLAVDVSRQQSFGSVQTTVHLFVGGAEVFSTEQSAAEREKALDLMVANRIKGVQQAGLKPFYGTAPAYPAALSRSGGRGEVWVTMKVTAQGTVRDPAVERATDPLFAEAALASVREWRFLPRVKDGQAVETKVSIPIVFDPPNATNAAKG